MFLFPTHPHKRQCAATYGLNHLGPEGYHWRVFVEDKHPVPGGGTSDPSAPSSQRSSFSWWDIQDENASLPIKEAKPSQLAKFFAGSDHDNHDDHNSHDYTSKAKGAFQSLGKTLSHAVVGGTSDDNDHNSPTVKVIAFKLLDLVKMYDDFATKHGKGQSNAGGSQGVISHRGQHHRRVSSATARSGMAAATTTPAAASTPAPHHRNNNVNAGYTAPTPPVRQQQQQQQQAARPAAPPRSGGVGTPASGPGPSQQQRAAQQQQQQRPAAQPQQEASLMDFGPPTSKASVPINETRAQKLKREYAEKNASAQRVWDPIDERWVEAENNTTSSNNNSNRSSSMASTGSASFGGASKSISFDDDNKKKPIGIKLDDASNAVGKSATVQAAVHARVNDMKQSQAKALQEVREREMKKKSDEAEEDIIRKQLEPKIKLWSEEHGKKKQLRALLASLHTILWPNSGWKSVTIGDLLDSKKCKLQFHKASRVVHPDKTHHLPAEQRFLAKRIFDSLSQAKNEFDDSENK